MTDSQGDLRFGMEQTAIIRKPGTFTTENAREMALRGNQAKKDAVDHRNRILNSLPANADERRRFERILQQIELIDDMISQCDCVRDLKDLVASKDKLYHMIFPKRGSLRPKAGRTIEQPTIDAQDWQPISKPSVTPNP